MSDDPLLKLATNKTMRVRQSLRRRRRGEWRFRSYGIASISFALLFLLFLVSAIVMTGASAFVSTQIQLTFQVQSGDSATDARQMIRRELRDAYPNVTNRQEKRGLYQMLSPEAEYVLAAYLQQHQPKEGERFSLWLPAGDRFNQFNKGKMVVNEKSGFKAQERLWFEGLEAEHRIRSSFNWRFFTSGDSRNPEVAGIAGAFMGSMFTLLTALVLSFPIGVGAAIYLEEYAPKNRLTDIIEININNLAAVPSIVFGLLGLAIFLNVMELPRSTPLVGGLVLTLMTLPTIIISSRASLKAVPPSIRDAALAMGASRTQTVFHHVVPLALPGMFTGSIIGMAQALGETAPLLMIGMVAFIVDVPTDLVDAATALPVQIFLWSENPERGFVELTSAAIMVLLVFLFLMNGVALFLRRKLERKW